MPRSYSSADLKKRSRCASSRKMAGPSAVGYDFIPSKTPVPYWSPCARTCTFASPQGTSLPLNQIVSVGVKPITRSPVLNIYRVGGAGPISQSDVSEFRIEKRRTEAALTLTTGSTVKGCFFLSGSSPTHSGPERVADLLNGEAGFFPFELNTGGAPCTVLYNRSQVVQVALFEEPVEA